MYEFTKEELIEIRECGNYSSTLRYKIEDLIESCDQKIVVVWHCEKCGHVQ